MSLTLRRILDQVFGESGFEIPDVYVNNQNPNVLQAVYLANRSARILQDFPLNRIGENVGTFSTTFTSRRNADGSVSVPLPSDFHSYVPDTATLDGTVIGVELPTSPDAWAYVKSLGGNIGGVIYARFVNNELIVLNPVAGSTFSFEYLSKYPILDAATNVAKLQFESDNDVWGRDDDLICLDIKWRFKKEKGLDWEADLQIFKQYANVLRARDRGAQTLTYPCSDYGPPEPYTNLWVQ